jgi:hypothetical protein
MAAVYGRAWIERGYWAEDYENWRERREIITVTAERLACFKPLLNAHRPHEEIMLHDDARQTFSPARRKRSSSCVGRRIKTRRFTYSPVIPKRRPS